MIVIYNDDICEYIDNNKEYIKDFLNDMQIFINDETIIEQAQSDLQSASDELKNSINFYDNITKYDSILVLADLGLWRGRKQINKKFKSLKEALSICFEDYNKLYFKTKKSTLILQAAHHDGVNYFKFYKVIRGKKYAINLNDLQITF